MSNYSQLIISIEAYLTIQVFVCPSPHMFTLKVSHLFASTSTSSTDLAVLLDRVWSISFSGHTWRVSENVIEGHFQPLLLLQNTYSIHEPFLHYHLYTSYFYLSANMNTKINRKPASLKGGGQEWWKGSFPTLSFHMHTAWFPLWKMICHKESSGWQAF